MNDTLDTMVRIPKDATHWIQNHDGLAFFSSVNEIPKGSALAERTKRGVKFYFDSDAPTGLKRHQNTDLVQSGSGKTPKRSNREKIEADLNVLRVVKRLFHALQFEPLDLVPFVYPADLFPLVAENQRAALRKTLKRFDEKFYSVLRLPGTDSVELREAGTGNGDRALVRTTPVGEKPRFRLDKAFGGTYEVSEIAVPASRA